jgi:hypothetical protein
VIGHLPFAAGKRNRHDCAINVAKHVPTSAEVNTTTRAWRNVMKQQRNLFPTVLKNSARAPPRGLERAKGAFEHRPNKRQFSSKKQQMAARERTGD